jgi:hypothetical protein
MWDKKSRALTFEISDFKGERMRRKGAIHGVRDWDGFRE